MYRLETTGMRCWLGIAGFSMGLWVFDKSEYFISGLKVVEGVYMFIISRKGLIVNINDNEIRV